MNTRNKSVDILKGIGIIFVLTAHFIGGYYSNFVYTFHMPLFFIVAGLFIKPESLIVFIKKSFSRLINPVLITCVLIVIVLLFFRAVDISDCLELRELFWKDNPVKPYDFIVVPGNMWFLFAVFWSKVFFNLYLNYTNAHTKYLFVLIILGLGAYFIGQYYIFPFYILQGVTMLPLLWVGYWFKHSGGLVNGISKWFLLIVLLWFISTFDGGIGVSSINYKYGYVIDLVLACGGTYLFFLVSKFIETNTTYIRNLLVFLGKNTIILVCMPGIESACFPMQDVLPVDLPMRFIWVGGAKVLWCVASFYLCMKVSFLRKIFGVV